MKRKLIYISTAYALGLLFASISVSPGKYAIPVILSGILVFFAFCKALEKGLREILLMLIPFFIAFGVYRFYNCYVYETLLKYDGMEGYFSGEITDIIDYSDDNSRYILDGSVNNTINAKIICYNTSYNCKIGDTMSFDCEFSKPDKDYLFDSRNYYKPKNIYLTANNITNTEISENKDFLIRNILYGFRDKMITEFRLNMNRETSAFLSAMVFGDKSGIDDSSKTMLYRSGIGHIMAISGIHVSVCAGFLMLILKKLRLNKFISFGILCIFLLAMIIIVESPMSVIRASVMLAVLYGAELLRRENDTFNSLALAVLLICISNPFVIHNQGFLLSVSGTYGIGVLAPYMTANTKSGIVKSILSMFYVSVSVIPLSIMYFDEVSIISPIANIILIPLCSLSLLIGLIFVISGGLLNFLLIAEYLIKAVIFITNLMGRNQFVYISGNSDTAFIILISLFIIGISMYLILKNRKAVNIIIVCGFIFLSGYSLINNFRERDILEITVLGKGSNSAVVLTCNGNTDIIDLSGHHKSPDYVRKYLLQKHTSDINNLLLTHKKASSYASYLSAMKLVDIRNIYKYSGNEIQIIYNNYLIKYDNEILTLISGNYSVCVSPYIYNGETADIFIFYGKSKNDTDFPENLIVCNDKCNNFSIRISGNSLDIRRL